VNESADQLVHRAPALGGIRRLAAGDDAVEPGRRAGAERLAERQAERVLVGLGGDGPAGALLWSHVVRRAG